MADSEQLDALRAGLEAWNAWRRANRGRAVDLAGADLRGADISILPALRTAEARGVFGPGAGWSFIANEVVGWDVPPLDLRGADLSFARLDGADLRFADLSEAELRGAHLAGADLWRANLTGAGLRDADLSGANLRAADLSFAALVRCGVEGAEFGYSTVYGAAVWELRGTPKGEAMLQVAPPDAPEFRADGLAFAPLLHAIARDGRLAPVIEGLTGALALVLSRFGEARRPALDAIRAALSRAGLVPVVFDFAGPRSQDTTGTVETMARLSRLVLADLTDPSSVPHELATLVPFLRRTPVALLRRAGEGRYAMAADLAAYPWVLPTHDYADDAALAEGLPGVVARALALGARLRGEAAETD